MRSSEEMFDLFYHMAGSDERIRVMTLEGSRVNPSVKPDIWQDYDITFLVRDIESFKQSDDWLSGFGELVLMQKPEAMDLFPPSIPEGWFSYLLLFEDGIKIDLTLVPWEDMENYFQEDPLIRILLDKDGICPEIKPASDEPFWVQKPSREFLADCTNEFSFSCTYAVRGLFRKELLSVSWMMEQVIRPELLRMLGYFCGAGKGYPLNTGKHDRWLPDLLPEDMRKKLCATYRLDSLEACEHALHAAIELFEQALAETCGALGYERPDDLDRAKRYITTLKSIHNN